MNAFRDIARWARHALERALPPRKVRFVEGDSLPTSLPWRDVVIAREGEEEWCLGLRCPCGCGETIELMLLREAEPRWTANVDLSGRPTVHPSIWRQKGCRSHFWIHKGRVQWVDEYRRGTSVDL